MEIGNNGEEILVVTFQDPRNPKKRNRLSTLGKTASDWIYFCFVVGAGFWSDQVRNQNRLFH